MAEDIFIEKLPEDYFQNPQKDITLRTIPKVILSELNKSEKPLVLKKNIVEKIKAILIYQLRILYRYLVQQYIIVI
jgi:hypothetical protein